MSKENKGNKDQLKRTLQLERGYRDHHRYSDGHAIAEKLGKLDDGNRFNRLEKGGGREVLGSLKSIQNYNLISTIDMLKRQAQLLDLQEDLGKVHKFSTLQQFDIFPSKQILLQVTKFRKQNARKIAKGRPQLYNWVKNHKKEIADMQCDYKTQICKKSSKQLPNQNEKLTRHMLKQNKQGQVTKLKQNNRNHSSCQKSRRKLTFVERLKKLEDVKEKEKEKEKGQMYQIIHRRRVHSQNEEQRCQIINLRTMC